MLSAVKDPLRLSSAVSSIAGSTEFFTAFGIILRGSSSTAAVNKASAAKMEEFRVPDMKTAGLEWISAGFFRPQIFPGISLPRQNRWAMAT